MDNDGCEYLQQQVWLAAKGFVVIRSVFTDVQAFSIFGNQLDFSCAALAAAPHFLRWCRWNRRGKRGQVRCLVYFYSWRSFVLTFALSVYLPGT